MQTQGVSPPEYFHGNPVTWKILCRVHLELQIFLPATLVLALPSLLTPVIFYNTKSGICMSVMLRNANLLYLVHACKFCH